MHEIRLVEDPYGDRPLEGGQNVVQRAPHLILVGENPRGLGGAQEEMAERFTPIGEGACGPELARSIHGGVNLTTPRTAP